MRRSLLVTGLSGLLVAALATGPGMSPSHADTTPSYGGDPYGALWNILPPGSRGNIDATQLPQVLLGGGTTAVDGKNAPANYADQLEMYDSLTKKSPNSLTRADLSSLYKRENFTPQVVTSDEKPLGGVDIERDQYGVPYITGKTYQDTMYGAGYAAIEDRMFLMDVLRHTGAGRMAEFVGDTPANVAMDQAQLRTAFYTPKEAAAQVTHAAKRYGAAGRRLVRGLDSYIAGINAAQTKLCPIGVTGLQCPVEYLALQKTVQPWTRADVVYVASLVGGIFGKGGGAETANATYLQLLRKRFGPRIGDGVYRDLREKLDAGSPTTGSVKIGYGGGRGLELGKPGVAMPDLGGATAPGTGHIASRVTTRGAARVSTPPTGSGTATSLAPGLPADELKQLQKVRIGFQHGGMSNAVLVTRQQSTTGHPLAVFGPQTGYYDPQLLVEQVLKGPGVYARGVSFAGTNLVVELGRGKDYAWSATSASNDLVDTVAERLCNTDGSRPTVRSTAYRVGTRCVPMRHNQHVEHTFPNLTAPSLPKTYTFDIWRTRHGIVQSRTTVRGRPVALVLQRSTYGHEVDSVLGFSQFNNPNFVHGPQSFFKAASHVDFTFNWFYVDSNHIAFYTSSLLPKRAPGVAFDFPHWGDRKYDWQGYVGMAGHAHQIDPASGYLVSWNNRQTKTWSAPDDIWSWGDVHRSLALSRRVQAAIRGPRRITIQQLVGVMSGAASQDSRARYLLPDLLKAIGKDKALAPATSLLRQWSRAGAPRVDRDRNGAYSYPAAIALFDYWYQHGSSSLAYDVMRGRLGPLVTKVPQILDDHPREGKGSSWLDAPWYSWVKKELDARLGHPEATPFRYRYCGSGTLRSCRRVLRASLARAVAYALKTQGVGSVSQLTYDKTQDDIVAQTAGVVGVRPIDWQNRPTFQQVVEFHRHR